MRLLAVHIPTSHLGENQPLVSNTLLAPPSCLGRHPPVKRPQSKPVHFGSTPSDEGMCVDEACAKCNVGIGGPKMMASWPCVTRQTHTSLPPTLTQSPRHPTASTNVRLFLCNLHVMCPSTSISVRKKDFNPRSSTVCSLRSPPKADVESVTAVCIQ